MHVWLSFRADKKNSVPCSSIYFTIDNLHQIHFLYQFSLQFFLDIFHSLLVDQTLLEGVKDYDKRLSILTSNLFERSYLRSAQYAILESTSRNDGCLFSRISRGMLYDDKVVLGMILCRIFLSGEGSNLEPEFHFLLTGKEGTTGDLSKSEACTLLERHFEVFKGLARRLGQQDFEHWLVSPSPEDEVRTVSNCSTLLECATNGTHALS